MAVHTAAHDHEVMEVTTISAKAAAEMLLHGLLRVQLKIARNLHSSLGNKITYNPCL